MIKTSLITQNCYLLVEREKSSMNGPSQIVFLLLFSASVSLISSSFHQRFNGDAIDNLEEWSNEEIELAPPKINLRENDEENNDIMGEMDDGTELAPPKINLRENDEENNDIMGEMDDGTELAPPKINLRENDEENNDIMDEMDNLEEGQLPITRLLRRVKDPCSQQTTHIRDLVRKVETLARNSFTVMSSLDEIYVVLEETRIEQKRLANALENHRNGIPS